MPETDTSLRRFLAERGMKKGDISVFIVDAVKWRVLNRHLVIHNKGLSRPHKQLFALKLH